MSNETAQREQERWLTAQLGEISDRTAFDQGDEFLDADQVRSYFTAAAQREMFGDEAITDEQQLERWANLVIEQRWHMSSHEHPAD